MSCYADGKEQTMSRYIDVEWLLNFFEPYPNEYHTPLGTLRACVDDAPSIDIVTCGECKYASDDGTYGCMCEHFNDTSDAYHRMWSDDFCSYGKRESE